VPQGGPCTPQQSIGANYRLAACERPHPERCRDLADFSCG
jgi:hypothetical protein